MLQTLVRPGYLPPPPCTADNPKKHNTQGAVWESIDGLDFDCIKIKAMDQKEGYAWSREQTDAAADAYKRFLYLSAITGGPMVPTEQIDKFWHLHILDTRKYAADCETVFGYFLHHFPYLGMRGPEDAKELERQFVQTCELYRQVFGEDYHGSSTNCNSPNCQACMGCVSGPTSELTEIRPSFAK